MKKSSSAFLSIFIAFVLVLGVLSYKENIYGQTTATAPSSNSSPNSTSTMNMTNNASAGGGESSGTTVTRDSVTLLLEGHSLPKGEYIELYDATPSKIVDGHFVAKVPCNSKGQSEVDLLTGEAPNLKSTDAEFVKQLSTPGKLCLYHVDLVSDAKNTITDVAIKNNSTKDISFPASSSVSVGVNSIAPLPPGQG
jgi:hypothetical protein